MVFELIHLYLFPYRFLTLRLELSIVIDKSMALLSTFLLLNINLSLPVSVVFLVA